VTGIAFRASPVMLRSRAGLAAFVGLLGAVLVFVATRPNAPGLAIDGVAYVSAAESLVRSGELRTPFTRWANGDSTAPLAQWPPGTSLLIAVPHSLGLPVIDSARLVLMISAFATLFGVVLMVAEAGGIAAAMIAAAMAIATPELGQLHRSVWSEPPFIACVVALLVSLVRAPDRPLRHGLIGAAAVLLRYAGIALSAAAAIWALWRPGPLRVRARSATIAALPGLIVQAWWASRTSDANEAIRPLGFYQFDMPSLLFAGRTVRQLLVPAPLSPGWRTLVAVIASVAMIALITLAVRRLHATGTRISVASSAPDARMFAALGILAACYAGVLIASRLFVDRWIGFEGRHLATPMLLAEVAVAVATVVWWRSANRGARIFVASAVGLWIVTGLALSIDDARLAMRDGRYMTNNYWRTAGVLEWVRTDGRNVPIYSNYPSAVYVHTGRPAREIPRVEEVRRVREFGAMFARTGGVFVAFHAPSPWLLPNDEVARFLSFREVARFPDGVIWAASDTTSQQSAVQAGAARP
jgi:hypothetical protein